MAWEKRRNGRSYYYRGRREGSRIVKEYIGGGEKGRRAAAEDAAARRKTAEAARLRHERELPANEIAGHLGEFGHLLKQVGTCDLLYAGWTQHRREWKEPKCLNRK